jgi:hypothetical protein
MILQNIIDEMDQYWSTGEITKNMTSLDDELFDLVDEERMRQKEGDSYGRELIWSHVSRLNDDMIKQYLNLDSQTNNLFAELAEEKREWFEEDNLPTITNKQLLNIKLKNHSRLFLDILNNPKKIRLVENYIKFVNDSNDTNFKKLCLPKYLKEHNLDGIKVNNFSESSGNFYNYDFVSGKTFQTAQKPKNQKNLFDSLTYGLDDELKQRFQSAISLKHKREKIIENYIKFVSKSTSSSIKGLGLQKYLYEHSLNGEKINNLLKSCRNFYCTDFVSGMSFQTAKKQKNIKNLFASLTYDLDDNLKQRFQSAISLKHIREKIIGNYIKFVSMSIDSNIQVLKLHKYLEEHNLNSKKVNKLSKSCSNFNNYDFVSGMTFQTAKKQKNSKNLFGSLTYDLDNNLKQRFQSAISLKYQRKKIIENYIKFVNNLNDTNIRGFSLKKYLREHNLNGEKVDNPLESCYNFYNTDFVSGMTFQTAKKQINSKNLFASLTYSLDDKLKQRFQSAISLKYQRKKIIENYIKFVNNLNDTNVIGFSLKKYLKEHNLDGIRINHISESCNNIYNTDFVSGMTFKTAKKQMNLKKLFDSLTYGFDDELKQRFRSAILLKQKREKIIENYILFVNESNDSIIKRHSLHKYFKEHNLDGIRVDNFSESCSSFYNTDFIYGKNFRYAKKQKNFKTLFDSITYKIDSKLKQEFSKVYWRNVK